LRAISDSQPAAVRTRSCELTWRSSSETTVCPFSYLCRSTHPLATSSCTNHASMVKPSAYYSVSQSTEAPTTGCCMVRACYEPLIWDGTLYMLHGATSTVAAHRESTLNFTPPPCVSWIPFCSSFPGKGLLSSDPSEPVGAAVLVDFCRPPGLLVHQPLPMASVARHEKKLVGAWAELMGERFTTSTSAAPVACARSCL
jgi:hypothetical protein